MKQGFSGRIICFGEILWDMLPGERTLGGAPWNVAYHIFRLGGYPVCISRTGADDPGTAIRDRLRQLGMDREYIQIDERHPTGQVNVSTDAVGEVHYEILPDAAWDHISFREDMEALMTEKDCLVYGSLASRSPQSAATLARLLEGPGWKVLDLNLRSPFYSRESVLPLLAKADMVKLNSRELGLVSGWFAASREEQQAMAYLSAIFHWKSLIVTRGDKGSCLWENGCYYPHAGFRIKPVDTVGCGDAFLAGYLMQLRGGADPEQRLAFAGALGAWVASFPGACPSYTLSQFNQWFTRQDEGRSGEKQFIHGNIPDDGDAGPV